MGEIGMEYAPSQRLCLEKIYRVHADIVDLSCTCPIHITHSHGSARVLYKDDDASQWENGKIDPLPPPNPLTDRHKKLHT